MLDIKDIDLIYKATSYGKDHSKVIFINGTHLNELRKTDEYDPSECYMVTEKETMIYRGDEE